MLKSKINLTLDRDLIEFIRTYAQEQRTTISEVFTQFVLNLKRTREDDPTEIIMADPAFRESLLNTLSKIQNGKMKWHTYDEVFK